MGDRQGNRATMGRAVVRNRILEDRLGFGVCLVIVDDRLVIRDHGGLVVQ